MNEPAHFVVADDVTGLIKTTGFIDPSQLGELQVPLGHTLRIIDAAPVGGESRLVMWTEEDGVGSLKPRPVLDVTPDKTEVVSDGVDKVTIPDVPSGTGVRLEAPGEPSHTHTGGALEMAFTEPGTYRVELTPPLPALPTTITIEATE